jgi:hypothetical protein
VKFDESHACLDATRTQLLCGIRTWVHSVDPDEKRILWLSGCAGSGKSSVANSTAMLFDGVGCLGACFRFNRDKEGLNSPKFLFGNLCYQLVHFSKSLESKVLPVINMMGHVGGSSLQTQAKKLIVDSTNAAELVGPVVVVIDALDESGDKKMRKNALLAIAAEFPRLPRSVKVFITSRDEPDIRGSLESCSRELRIDDAVGTAEDIASYIKSRMKTIRLHSHFDSDWPGQEKLQELNRRAELLFIWASVACNFVEDSHDPAGELNRLLAVKSVVRREAHSPFAQLDRLYCSILENAFPNMHDAQDDFRYVVGTIVALRALFTQIGLDSLLGLGDGSPLVLPGGRYTHLASSNGIISSLRPILRIEFDSTGTMGLVRLLHPSLYDFLTSRADEHFRIDLLEQNGTLALRCLAVMNSQLKFNIINVCDLSLSNNEVGDLPRLIGDCISEALRYSCHFFAHHLATVRDLDTILRDALDKFIFRHLLHWIEAMSWQGKISEAEDCLQVLAGWMKVRVTILIIIANT